MEIGGAIDGAALVDALVSRAQLTEPERRADYLYQAGLAADLRVGDPERAVGLYLEALNLDGDHPASLEALLGIIDQRGAVLGAALDGEHFDRLTAGVHGAELLRLRAERRLLDGDLDGARSDLAKVRRRDANHPAARFLEEEIIVASGDAAELAAWCAGDAADTGDEGIAVAALHLSARIASSLGDAETATVSARRALKLAPDDVDLHGTLVDALVAARDDQAAILATRDFIDRVSSARDRLATTIRAAQWLAWSAKLPEQAVALISQAVPLDKTEALPTLDTIAALETSACIARSHGLDAELAIWRDLGQRLDSSSRQATIFTRIAQLLLDRNQELGGIEGEMAVRYLEAALEAEPNYSWAQRLLTELYEEGAFPSRGRAALEERGRDEKRPDLLVEAARLARDELEKPREALATLRKAVDLCDEADLLGPESPLDAMAPYHDGPEDELRSLELAMARVQSAYGRHQLVGRMLAVLDREDVDAAKHLPRLVDLAPDDPFTLARLGAACRESGAWNALSRLLQREFELMDARDPYQAIDVIGDIGALCDQMGDVDAALQWYGVALDRRPDDLGAMAGAGRVLVREGRWEELANMFQGELQRATTESRRASMTFRLATLYERAMSDPQRAAACYQLVLTQNPHHLPSLRGLLRLAEQTGDWAQWAELAERWTRRETDHLLCSTLLCELGQAYEDELGDLENAVRAFREALERNPKQELARQGVIRCLYRLGRRGEAAETTGLALNRELAEGERLDVLSAILLLADDDDAAAGHILRDFPTHVPSLLVALRGAFAGEDVQRAAALARALGESMPASSVATGFLRLAHLLARLGGEPASSTAPSQAALSAIRSEANVRDMGDLEGLARMVLRAANAEQDPLLAAPYLATYARCTQARGRIDEAAQAYENILADQPEFISAAKGLKFLHRLAGNKEMYAIAAEREGRIILNRQVAVENFKEAGQIRRRFMGDLDGAILDLETVLRLDPSDSSAFESLREMYSLRGDARALYHLLSRRAEALEDPTECKGLLLVMAQVAMTRISDADLAIRCHEQVLGLDPTHVQSYRVLAQLFSRRELWQKAIDALVEVLHLTDDQNLLAYTYQQVAKIYDQHLGDSVRAIEAYTSLLRHDGERVPALRRLAQLLHADERWEPAAKTYGRLLQREHDRKKLLGDLRALAEICTVGLQDPEKAEQCLEQALRLHNQDIGSHRALVEHYRRLGREDRVQAHLGVAARQFATALLRDLEPANALAGLFQVARWGNSDDQTFLVAAVGEELGRANDEMRMALGSGPGLQTTAPSEKIPVELTDTTIPGEINISLLQVLRYANEGFQRLIAPSAKQLGCSRRTRLSSRDSDAGRALIAQWPRIFSLEVEAHALPDGPAEPRAYLTDKQAVLLVRKEDVARAAAGDPVFLFQLGAALAPLSMGVASWTSAADGLEIPLAAAVVRQFAPTWLLGDDRSTDPRVDEERLARYMARLSSQDVMGHALDVSGTLDGRGLLRQRDILQRAFHRLALIPVADPRPVLAFLRSKGDPWLRDALEFLLSERLVAMRSALGF
jgi:tetratricopeptide (TPR) repeat protein